MHGQGVFVHLKIFKEYWDLLSRWLIISVKILVSYKVLWPYKDFPWRKNLPPLGSLRSVMLCVIDGQTLT